MSSDLPESAAPAGPTQKVTVGRRCTLHYNLNCTRAACLEDLLDLQTNPNRKRPTATPGAPETTPGGQVDKRLRRPVNGPLEDSPQAGDSGDALSRSASSAGGVRHGQPGTYLPPLNVLRSNRPVIRGTRNH